MKSLELAWLWYERVRKLAGHMDRLGEKFWDREEWAQLLSRDNRFRDVASGHLREDANAILEDLDDLGVLLMFSVFEAIVRDQVLVDVSISLPEQLHPAVEHAIDGLKKDIETGSFGKVTEAFKSLDRDLIEQVNQVRRYRNWVAHGRRESRPPRVSPEVAYERLDAFLTRINGLRERPGEVISSPGE